MRGRRREPVVSVGTAERAARPRPRRRPGESECTVDRPRRRESHRRAPAAGGGGGEPGDSGEAVAVAGPRRQPGGRAGRGGEPVDAGQRPSSCPAPVELVPGGLRQRLSASAIAAPVTDELR